MDEKIEKSVHNIEFEWVDSDTYVKNNAGELVPAGTCIRLSEYILFLSPLSEEYLKELKHVVDEAINHELQKKKKEKKLIITDV
jgi:hypothetical protein